MKTCDKCGISKGSTFFYKDNSDPSGLKPYCRKCSRVADDGHRVVAQQMVDRDAFQYAAMVSFFKTDSEHVKVRLQCFVDAIVKSCDDEFNKLPEGIVEATMPILRAKGGSICGTYLAGNESKAKIPLYKAHVKKYKKDIALILESGYTVRTQAGVVDEVLKG